MGTLHSCHDIVPVSATEEPVFHCSSLGRQRPLTAVLRVIFRIETAPLHMLWAEDVRLVCCRHLSSSPPLGLVSCHDRGRKGGPSVEPLVGALVFSEPSQPAPRMSDGMTLWTL